MKPYKDMNLQELRAERVRLEEILKTFKDKNLNLLIARGIPSVEQVEVSNEMLDVINSKTVNISSDGVDCRNYGGGLTGIAEAKELFSEYLGVGADEIMVAGNSSMGIIGEILAHSIRKGVLGSTKPWSAYPKIKFLCPVPGYDRHFGFCEYFDIEMIPVPLGEEGPDMDIVEKLAAEDETIKGMWCVPKYSNPSGISYSDETIRRLANMKTAADDFRIFYDNAYAVHYVYKMVEILNILEECKKAGNPNRVYMFGSTSKMTFPGAGVALFAASKENIEHVIKGMSAM
ncbi:aminotransferase class I/II-fold pyridoxal phosphate-dependent enzyme [Cloacibacillus porcorum]|uniref:aminotransferase class I/II-fold pyridoxal phosphate-dependent enzyme n=1 Tax=Cloacibacillus porcorum TaxID=1197717 RepID=UPI0023F0398D|nr:aminotransferase class I/II-fold pyridoxal phosphate-dependent enzyme [Cloacibacillus porcorum]